MKKYLLPSLLFCSIVFLTAWVTPPEEKGNKLQWLNGDWSGVGYQISTHESWTMEVKSKAKLRKIQINYPSLNCQGEWVLQKGNKHRAVFKEVITHGKEFCLDQGMVIITKVDDNHISYSYFSSDSPLTLDASATLERRKFPRL